MSAAPIDPAAAVKALVRQLEDSQWASPSDIVASQFRHLGQLAEYCNGQSTFFARRLANAGLNPADLANPSGLARLPVLTRRDLQTSQRELFCREIPRGHGESVEARTSGSTGEPVVVRRTGVTAIFWNALAMRDLRWHRRHVSGRLCSIRANVSSPVQRDDWGPPASLLARTGPMLALPIAAEVARLVDWVVNFQPNMLVVYPSTLEAIAAYCRRRMIALPELRHVLTTGETLLPRIRVAAEETFDAVVADCYSSQEVGYLALECPVSGLYHVMAESLMVEVLREDGSRCRPGEIGRVTVTDLHNYATPLVRYDIGDCAEVAPPCRCGRGLPTWKRILGRQRNFILMPDGTRHWPVTGFLRCRDVAPVLQYQLVQEDRETIEARLVVERALSKAEEDGLRRLFQAAVGHPFALRLSYVDGRIPAGPSGKYEEFVCHVADGCVAAAGETSSTSV
ncbi:MAG TPA: hypothetical protein VFO67_11970 [Gemmatimonadales bacterium]|nr:hypothetical protein [Gemmatimonadales bacterium]